MKIALVCPYSLDRPGGVATHVIGLARWLQSQGNRVVVVGPGTQHRHDDLQVELLGSAVDLRFNGSVAQLALRPGQVRRAKALVASADVVHVHEPLTPGVGFATARAAGERLVTTHHANFRAGPLAVGLRLAAAQLPPRISIAVSAAAARTAHDVAGVEARVIPNAIQPPPPRRVGGERTTVAFLGRLDERRKGYSVFAQLAEALPDVDFIAIGPGRGLPGRVRQLGVLTAEELTHELLHARLVVAPNRFGESFGMVLIEALAHGCGIAASDLPAFQEVVTDPTVVAWFQPDDTASALTAVRRRLASPVDPQRARAAAARFTWPMVGPRIAAVYAERVATAARAPG